MRTVAIIQARMGATRLPGKVLKQLAGKSVLEQVIGRVRQAGRLQGVMVATTTAFALALTATHRVIDWVHDHATNMWADAKPSTASCLTGGHVHMIGVANLAYCGIAVFIDPTNFTRSQLDERMATFAVGEDSH